MGLSRFIYFIFSLFQDLSVKNVKGCLSKMFFEKPDSKADFSIKIPCKACGERMKPNKNNSTTFKRHAINKHNRIWTYLNSKRDGLEFSIGDEVVLQGKFFLICI